MKPKSILLMIFCFQILAGLKVFAQPVIKINEQVKVSSEPMIVKSKGISTFPRYEFGTYKIISGKSGWKKSSSQSPLFGSTSNMKSSVRQSFIFVDSWTDTSVVNVSIIKSIETDNGNWFSRTFLNWKDFEVKKGEGAFEANFSFNQDNSDWKLKIIYPLAIAHDGDLKTDAKTKFRGILTNADTSIEIRNVTEREDGKKSLFNPVFGYEFFRDSMSLAALQVMPVNKMAVWIRNDLPPRMKFVLANAAAALLVKNYSELGGAGGIQ